MDKNQSFFKGIRMMLETCMGVKKGEEVLIVGDTDNLVIANSFFSVAEKLGAEATLVVMKHREMHGNEPPKVVALRHAGAEVIILPTSKSLSHTQARESTTRNGARIASLPGINKEILEGPMKADYSQIRERSKVLVAKVSQASSVLLTTKKGTRLELNIKGREGKQDSGIYLTPGA